MTAASLSRLVVSVRRCRAPAMLAPLAVRAARMLLSLLMPLLLLALLLAMTWSFWIVASEALGEPGATMAVGAAIAGAATFSRYAEWSFVAALILVGFGGLFVSIGVAYVVAVYTLIYGG